MNKLIAKLKAAASWTKRELLRVEVVAKSAAAAAFGGGLNSIYSMYSNGKHFELSVAHLLELKSAFISGAFIGIVCLLIKSPLGKALKLKQLDANSAA